MLPPSTRSGTISKQLLLPPRQRKPALYKRNETAIAAIKRSIQDGL